MTIVGAGPAGLYFALLMKKADPTCEISVLERDGADDTFGWGIVFSDQTFSYLRDNDEPPPPADEKITMTRAELDAMLAERETKAPKDGNPA